MQHLQSHTSFTRPFSVVFHRVASALLLAMLVMDFAACKNDQPTTTPQTTDSLNAAAKTDSATQPAANAEAAKPEAEELQGPTHQDIFNAYVAQLKTYDPSTIGYGGYYMKDLTGSGIPELIVYYGLSAPEETLDIYTFNNGAVRKLYGEPGNCMHMAVYQGKKGLILYWAHQGGYAMFDLVYQGGRFVQKDIGGGELEPDEELPEPPGRDVKFVNPSNLTPLRKALGL